MAFGRGVASGPDVAIHETFHLQEWYYAWPLQGLNFKHFCMGAVIQAMSTEYKMEAKFTEIDLNMEATFMEIKDTKVDWGI